MAVAVGDVAAVGEEQSFGTDTERFHLRLAKTGTGGERAREQEPELDEVAPVPHRRAWVGEEQVRRHTQT